MNKGPATLQQCAKRPDLAGWYTGENSDGVPPRPLFVDRRVSGGRLHQGERVVRRVPSSACVLLVHSPHGRRQLEPPGARGAGTFGHVHSF